MKKCPYCAEEVQDAAVVCKHCHRELGAGPTSGRDAPSKPSRSIRSKIGTGLLLVALLLAGALYASNTRPDSGVQQQGLAHRAVRPPFVTNVAVLSNMDVDAGKILRFDWTVPADQSHCHLSGRIEVTSGGNRDVKIFLGSEDEFTNWTNGHEAKAFFVTDKTTVQNLDVNFVQTGPMVLALSNTFSAFTGKRVRLQDVRATCS